VEDSAQLRWSGAVRGAIRDIAAEPDDMTRRGGAASRTHGSSAFQKQSARIIESDFFSRQCVGGDGHPVGVGRQFNDPRIYAGQFVVPFKQAQPRLNFSARRTRKKFFRRSGYVWRRKIYSFENELFFTFLLFLTLRQLCPN
jgi:hypothetical protein